MAEDAIKRILFYRNPFDQIEATPLDTNEELQKKYKKLALLIHPDKCKHPKADEAFATLGKALKVLEDSEKRAEFVQVMQFAEKKIEEELEKDVSSKKKETGSHLCQVGSHEGNS